jgi:hypothetical protein
LPPETAVLLGFRLARSLLNPGVFPKRKREKGDPMFQFFNTAPSLDDDRPVMVDVIRLFWWMPAVTCVVLLVGRLF